ncbi:MAG: DUF1016 family protein [Lachnospiraceae bacterium]|nr:DUF1016 family protein [Lachnospiraceae bacterium]
MSGGDFTEKKEQLEKQIDNLKKMREELGMNRTEFSQYIGIPLRTLEEWEAGRRQMPEYVLRLLVYYTKIERLLKEKNLVPKENQKAGHLGDDLMYTGQDSIIANFMKTDDILQDMCGIIDSSMKAAHQAVNIALVQRNWLIGYRIAEEEMGGEERSGYGLQIIRKLAKELTELYGKGYDRSNLYHCLRFYKTFPEIVDTVCRQFGAVLSWSHYRVLLQVEDKRARDWYEKEAIEQTWSVRTLQRNVSSQYYYRILQTQKKELLKEEMQKLTAENQDDKLEFIKNPVVAEFLGLSSKADFTESDLENSILTNLQHFLMELGKGYAFVARQQHIHTEKQDYYIDLVFYNYILKCFVLIDLKTQKITHQDIGQMDMYIRMYDELKRSEGDNPTMGIVLCSDTDEDIARYSVMHGNEQLFASKYKLYLPTEEELRAEIETQKSMFYLQQQEKINEETGFASN